MIRLVREDRLGPPSLLRVPFNGWVFRALGAKLTRRKPTETFHEFCVDVVKITFGQGWIQQQFARDEADRHVVAKWLVEYSALTKRDLPEGHKPGEIVSSIPSGGAQELVLFGRDLVYLTQLGKLPDRLIERLRHPTEFQGAWYEVRVASAMVHGGFDIEWIPRTSESHCEFTARHAQTGETFAVEAKSKRRSGILNEAGSEEEELRVLAHRNFRDALTKDAGGLPLMIFVDVNMPMSVSLEDAAHSWANHMSEYIGPMGSDESEPAKFAYAICTNFSWHHRPSDPVGGIATIYDKFPRYSENPTRHLEVTRQAVEAGLRRVGALPDHQL